MLLSVSDKDKNASGLDDSGRLSSSKEVNKEKKLNFREMSHKINAKLKDSEAKKVNYMNFYNGKSIPFIARFYLGPL